MKSHILSSDILEQQFGPTAIEVLAQDATTRITCTKVISSQQILELSYVEFMKDGSDAFPVVHQAVISGQSMGKAFRAHDIEFHRHIQATYRCNLPHNFGRWFGSNDPALVVLVSIFVGPDKTPYAKILETYSPAVSWPDPGIVPIGKQLDPIQNFNDLLQKL